MNTSTPGLTIYKASAGSGKTFILSASFIAHLIADEDDNAHKHQLAVTFTNKATAEMKERILQYLYALSHSDNDEDSFFQAVRQRVPSRITNRMIRQKAGHFLLTIIHDYDHFHVTTIDAFFQSLLANLAHEMGLSAGFKVEIGDDEVLSKAVERLLMNLEDGTDELKWVTRYIQDRLEEDKSWNVATELKKLSKQLMKEAYMVNRDLLHKAETANAGLALRQGAIDLTNTIVKDYKDLLNKKKKAAQEALAASAKHVDELISNGLTYENISRGNDVNKLLSRLADINDQSSEPSATFRNYADGSKSMLKAADKKNAEKVAQAEEVQHEAAQLVQVYDEAIYTINSCQHSLQHINPLRLLDAIDTEVTEINRENDRFMLAHTPLLFHQLSGKSDASFVFERAGTTYRHVMIDEFQDTSKLQWENMRHLLVENMAQGNSCMLVGDVKQGIYRFRGGDWTTLAQFSAGWNNALNTTVDIQTLDTNFRTGQRIVDFNNRLFLACSSVLEEKVASSLNLEQSDELQDNLLVGKIFPVPEDEEHDTHEVTQKWHHPEGFVRVELLESKNDKQENDQEETDEDYGIEESLAEQIHRLNAAGVPYDKMAILVRSKNDTKQLLKYFQEHPDKKVELISEEAFLLEASPAVQTIIHVLKYVSNPTNGIALHYAMQHCPEGKETEVKEIMDRWHREHYSGLPFYEVANRLITLFELNKMEGQMPYLYCFLDAILNYIEDNTADVKQFLKFWDESLFKKSIPSVAVKGVRILTIHKSKGLDFHTVFIPYCNWRIASKEPELVWATPTEEPYSEIPLLPVSMDKKAGNSIYRKLYCQEEFDRQVENLNLLYVGFTRCRQNLLVWSKARKNKTTGKDATTIAGTFHEALARTDFPKTVTETSTVYEIGEPSTREININKEKTDKAEALHNASNPLDYETETLNVPLKILETNITFRQSNNARIFMEQEEAEDAMQEEYRQTGILLHQLMSSIETAEEADRQIETFEREGLLPRGKSAEDLKKLLHRRMSHPEAKKWFDGSWQLYRECSIVYREDGKIVTKRPDRVMLRGNRAEGTAEAVVIDFKFGRFKAEHRTQVQEYMQLLRHQGFHEVKGYLWYLYTGSIEKVL